MGADVQINLNELNRNIGKVEGFESELPIESLPTIVIVDGYEIEIANNGEITIMDAPIEQGDYTITYDLNGGSGNIKSQFKIQGKDFKLTRAKPVRENYNFVGWTTNKLYYYAEYEAGAIYNKDEDITLYAVWKGTTKETINPANYGDIINYSSNNVTDWKIFYKDDTNLYIIATNCVPVSSLTLGNGITVGKDNTTYAVKSSIDSDSNSLVNWLKNTSYWSSFVNNSALYATGGPTMNQFTNSYNQKYNTTYHITDNSPTWNISHTEDTLYTMPLDFNTMAYWLPTTIAGTNGNVWNCFHNGSCRRDCWAGGNYFGVRPLVCLPNTAIGTYTNNIWTLQ